MYIELVHGVSNKQNLGGRPRGSRKGGVLVFLRHRHGVLLPSQETADFTSVQLRKGVHNVTRCYPLVNCYILHHFTTENQKIIQKGKSTNFLWPCSIVM